MPVLGKLIGFYKFVRYEHSQGTSKKTGNDYDFAQITLADDIESLKYDLDKKVIQNLGDLSKRDIVQVEIEAGESFGRTSFKVVNVEPYFEADQSEYENLEYQEA